MNYPGIGKIVKSVLLLSFFLTFTFMMQSCASKPQLLEPTRMTFSDSLRAERDDYIGSIEGCIVNRKQKPIKKLTVSAKLDEFINIAAEDARTDAAGCFAIDLFWRNQPYLLADVYPNPAEDSFTISGLDYLKSARTVSVEIPIVTGKNAVPLTDQDVMMYSVSYVLKKIAREVVNPRLRLLRYSVEDFNTGFPIVGTEVTLEAAGDIAPVDTILAAYISQQNLREIAAEATEPFITTSEVQKQQPGAVMEFFVMSYENYRLKVNHPNYHPFEQTIYIEKNLDKIVRLTPKDQKKRIEDQ